MLIGLIWIVSAVFCWEYPKALLQALSKRRLGQSQRNSKEYSISALLKTSLADRKTCDVLHLLNLAADTDPVALQQAVSRIFKHPASGHAENRKFHRPYKLLPKIRMLSSVKPPFGRLKIRLNRLV